MIRRLGNSQGVMIPRSVLDEAGIEIDSAVDMTVDGATIILRKVSSHPREGWAGAAAAISPEASDAEWLDADLDAKSRSENDSAMKRMLYAIGFFFKAMVLGGRAYPKSPGYDPRLSFTSLGLPSASR